LDVNLQVGLNAGDKLFKLDIKDVSAGIYMLEINYESGKMNQKLIVNP
jgi:hypothetical protein